MLLLKAATDTASDSITHACTHTPSPTPTPKVTVQRAEGGECSSLQLPLSQGCFENVHKDLQEVRAGPRFSGRIYLIKQK